MNHGDDQKSPHPEFGRRNLIKVSTLLGSAGLAQTGAVARPQTAAAPGAPAQGRPGIRDVLAKARERLYPTCRVCPVCNGVACSNAGHRQQRRERDRVAGDSELLESAGGG